LDLIMDGGEKGGRSGFRKRGAPPGGCRKPKETASPGDQREAC